LLAPIAAQSGSGLGGDGVLRGCPWPACTSQPTTVR